MDNQDYDVETGYFWVSSRYYSPELGRFIQPADVSTLKPSRINGLNLYSYVNNNPIGSAYSSSGFGGSAGGALVSIAVIKILDWAVEKYGWLDSIKDWVESW